MQTWGSEGDVQPFLALARGAAEAGHEVVLSIASARDAEYEAGHERLTIERLSGEVPQLEGAALIERVVATASPLKQFELVLEEAFAPHVDALDAAARSLAGRCDVLVRHHFLFMARAAAEAEGIPELSVFLTPDLLPTRQHPPTGMPSLGPLQGLGWWMMRKGVGGVLLPHARRFAQQRGHVAPRDVLRDLWCSHHGNLVGVSPALFPRPDDWPETHHLTGFWRGPMSSHGEPGKPAPLPTWGPHVDFA